MCFSITHLYIKSTFSASPEASEYLAMSGFRSLEASAELSWAELSWAEMSCFLHSSPEGLLIRHWRTCIWEPRCLRWAECARMCPFSVPWDIMSCRVRASGSHPRGCVSAAWPQVLSHAARRCWQIHVTIPLWVLKCLETWPLIWL